MNKRITIKDWANDERPREKMIACGARVMSNAELLAIILRSGAGSENVVELSRRILTDCGNDLAKLSSLSVQEIVSRYKGVGVAKATAIVSAMELSRRRFVSDDKDSVQIRAVVSSRDAFNLLRPVLTDLDHEEFWVLMLNKAGKVIAKQCLATGGIDSTVVDVRILLKKCIENKAVAMVVAHNHPSGNIKPSHYDKRLTGRIVNASSLVDIKLCDHIIIAGDCYYSFSDEGEL